MHMDRWYIWGSDIASNEGAVQRVKFRSKITVLIFPPLGVWKSSSRKIHIFFLAPSDLSVSFIPATRI